MTLYALIPGVCVALSVLLTAAPAVASELEQRSWAYLATRPNGIFWLLLGKFLVSVTWGTTAAWVGTVFLSRYAEWMNYCRMWLSLVGAQPIIRHGIFRSLHAGRCNLLQSGPMVFCMMYTVIVELVFGSIPAVINRMTVQFRLRTLFVNWMPLINASKMNRYFST